MKLILKMKILKTINFLKYFFLIIVTDSFHFPLDLLFNPIVPIIASFIISLDIFNIFLITNNQK